MKRLLLWVLMLAAAAVPGILPGRAEAFTPYDYRVLYTVNGEYVVYEFPDVKLYLPRAWESAMTVETTETGVAFFQTASYDRFLEAGLPKGGFLFKFRASPDESFRDRPEYEYLGYSETAKLHFYLGLPSDYEGYVEDADIRAEYDAMYRQIGAIARKAKLADSLYFYTEGVESTDPGCS